MMNDCYADNSLQHPIETYGSCSNISGQRITSNPPVMDTRIAGFGEDKETQGEGQGQQDKRERVWTNDRGAWTGNATTQQDNRGQRGPSMPAIQRENTRYWKEYRADALRWPTNPRVRCRNDGLSGELAGIHLSKTQNRIN